MIADKQKLNGENLLSSYTFTQSFSQFFILLEFVLFHLVVLASILVMISA